MTTRFADHVIFALRYGVFAYLTSGCAAATPATVSSVAPSAETFQFTTDRGDAITARFTVELRDPAAITAARKAVAAGAPDLHVYGRIVAEPTDYNAGWSFHLDPESVLVTRDDSIEVCDAAIAYVEEHLAEVGGSFLPNAWWCPWSSRFVKPPGATPTR